jgi:hypothetical protein
LANLSRYTRNIAVSVHWDDKRVLLGREPWDNIHELYRAIPELFSFSFIYDQNYEFSELNSEQIKKVEYDKESFNDECFHYIERLGLASYRFKSLESIDIEFFFEQCPQTLKLLYQSFDQALKSKPDLAKKFLYCMRGFFHKKYSSAHSDYETFHLFLSLISRHYTLDQESLRQDLIECFIARGGAHKKAKINDWRFFKSRPWSIELSTFEGIIHPDKLSFLGLNLRSLNLSAHSKEKFYGCVHVDIDFHHDSLTASLGHLHYFTKSDHMASSLPCATFMAESKSRLGGVLTYRRKAGSKISFFEDDLKKKALSYLEQWYPGLSSDVKKISLSFGEEIYIDDSFYYKTNFVPFAKKVALYDHSRADEKKNLKLVAYHGPHKNLSFGFYGQLLDLKEGSYFQ